MRLLLFIFLLPSISFAEVCKSWSAPQKIGALDHKIIDEASGLAASSIYEDRLYHINDGAEPLLYITDNSGNSIQSVKIKNFKPKDIEDMSYGPCGNSQCIVLADIGDNNAKRKTVQLAYIKEKKSFKDKVNPYQVVKLVYPDGAHDAEGMAMHPNGDIYITAKEYDNTGFENQSMSKILKSGLKNPSKLFKFLYQKALPVKIYKATKSQIDNYVEGEPVQLSYVGAVDLESVFPGNIIINKLVTAIDIHPDGDRFILLTYKKLIELPYDFKKDKVPSLETLEIGKDFGVLSLGLLPQQEAVAYFPNGSSFLHSTEYHRRQGPASLLKLSCLD